MFEINALVKSEFKLSENPDWEKTICEHFIANNKDPKVAEPLRIVDLDNMTKYVPLVKNSKVKQQLLMELLRSATHEKRVTFLFSIIFNSEYIIKK